MRKTAGVVAAVCAVAWMGTLIHPVPVTAGQDASSYTLVKDWAQLPDGKPWGVMSAVGVDAKGNVYGFVRAEPSSIMMFDGKGKYVRTFGDDSMMYAHGLMAMPDGTVWATDRKVQQAFKFDANGKLIMTLGMKNMAGDMTSQDMFNGVSDVAVAANGDLFISDGEGGNSRVVKLSKDGKFIKAWGSKGPGEGQFNTPHNIAIDHQGHVWVADRGNKRLQEFDQDGKFMAQFAQFGEPVSVAFDKNDTMYVADGAPQNQMIIGKTDGTVLETIHGLDNPHGITVSEDGKTIYVSESFGKNILKFVKK